MGFLMRNLKILILLLLAIALPSKRLCASHPVSYLTDDYVTVIIHGTRLPLVSSVLRYCFASTQGFYSYLELQNMGKSLTLLNNFHIANPILFPTDKLYSFGWDGKLSVCARKRAAHDLYFHLIELRKKLPATTKIRIISHSHGGNVVLHLAEEEAVHKIPLVIDQFIIMACPVQEQTKQFVTNPLFKSVLALFSNSDIVQIADPQGFFDENCSEKTLSERTFPQSERLLQLRINHFRHQDFLKISFICLLPRVIEFAYTHQQQIQQTTANNNLIEPAML
jgi:hypothetical protein